MSNALTISNAIESSLVQGDLSLLSPEQRISYYRTVCSSLGLNPLTKPFDYIKLNGKLTLYAKRDATDQLRKLNGVSIQITSREVIEGIYIVTAKATDKNGRQDESTGAVPIDGLKGEARANAMLKCETKAKRRVTLSICGLGLLDETEVESVRIQEIEDARTNPIKEAKAEIAYMKHDPKHYIVPFGKYKGLALDEITIHELASYVEFIQRQALEQGKEIRGQVLEFIQHATELIESRDVSQGESKSSDIPF